MKLEDSSEESMSSGGGDSPVEIFWQRYRRLVLRAGVEEGVAVWYRRHVEGLIRFIKPRRLRQANVSDVSEYLLRLHRREDTEQWQVRQADQALRLMYQELVKAEWAGEWAVRFARMVREREPSGVGAAEVHKPASCHSLRQNAASREMPSCTGNPARWFVKWRFSATSDSAF